MRKSPFLRLLKTGLTAAVGGYAFCLEAQFPDAQRPDLPPVTERRAAVLKEFDQDGDGFLSANEREAARKAWFGQKLSQRSQRGFFRPPPELMEEFDTNKDGELDEEESQKLRETMEGRFRQLQKDYDKNENGRLDEDEIALALKDHDAGKLKGLPRMFIQFAGGPPGRRGPGGPGDRGDEVDPAELVRRADRDGDGRLNAAELEEARAALSRLRSAAQTRE